MDQQLELGWGWERGGDGWILLKSDQDFGERLSIKLFP